MIKQYFTDSLVQIAIVLSLLRTDLNTYFTNNYVNYPEVQDIILGQTAAYAQTNFHIYNLIDSQPVHPKSIDNEPFSSYIFEDLRSLRNLYNGRTGPVSVDVSAFLLTLSSSSLAVSQQDVANSDQPSQQVNNETETNTTADNSDQQTGSTVLLGLGLGVGGSTPVEGHLELNTDDGAADLCSLLYEGSGLTKEDLDLIEVLWRQDIDLGIGREAFDDNLRHELEAKRELELQKDREKNKERELLQLKHEEQCRQQEQQWLSENFMQDGETGEWVPLSGRDVSQNSLPQFQPPSQPQPTEIYRPHQPLQANFMQYGNMNIVNPEVARECETFQMHQSLEVLSPPHPPPVQTQQCPQHSNYVTDSNSYRNPLPQTLPTSPMVPDVPYPTVVQEHPAYNPPIQEYQRHDSLEQRWMDLVNLLDLNPGTESHMSMLMNASMVSNATELASRTRNPVRQLNQDNSSDVLLQNATMPAMPSSINATMSSFDNAGLLQPRTYNSSVPSEGNASPLVWEPSRMLFPNITDSLNSEDSLEEVDELLPDIISDDMLEEITSADMPLTDGLLRMHVVDDGSSDSAMGSDIGSESPPQDYDSMSSPSDGLGGAMGGSPGYSHPSKYSPDDYNPNGNAYSLSPGGSSGQSNYSSSSNDTGFGFSESNNQIQHNHTYPCQPGAQPKEVKKYMKSDTPRQKGPHPRDRKRVDELNIPFTVDQIVESQVEEFNELLSGHKLADNQLQLVRDIRRRGKNKVAAHNCRKRKLDVIFTLEDEMTSLINAKERLVQERHMIDKQTHEMKDKFGQLYKEIFQSLRDEHGHPYDPQQFSLQQSSDGNVFLVPRNVSMDDQDSKINKKRKNDKKK